MNSVLYADSAQARALDKRLSGDDDVHWADGVSPEQAAENNQAWLESIRRKEAFQTVSSRKAIAAALNKMEAICGTSADPRRTA